MVQIVSRQLLVITVSLREIVHSRGNLQFLWIKAVIQFVNIVKRIPAFDAGVHILSCPINAYAFFLRSRRCNRLISFHSLGLRLHFLTLLPLLGELLEVDIVLCQVVISLDESLNLGREALCVLKLLLWFWLLGLCAQIDCSVGRYFLFMSFQVFDMTIDLLLQSPIEQLTQAVVRDIGLFLWFGSFVLELAILGKIVQGVRDELDRSFVDSEIWSEQVDVYHGITFLLVASLV